MAASSLTRLSKEMEEEAKRCDPTKFPSSEIRRAIQRLEDAKHMLLDALKNERFCLKCHAAVRPVNMNPSEDNGRAFWTGSDRLVLL
jgi:hypothetical protein